MFLTEMSDDVPDMEELYRMASSVDGFHRENLSKGGRWGDQPSEYEASNFFVWDLGPKRFNHNTEVPDEIVVLSDTYRGFLEGAGFLVKTPLYEDEDFEDAVDVLGTKNVVRDDSFRGVEELDTPKDVMQLHQLTDRLDIDLYTPSEWNYGLTRSEGTDIEAIDNWSEKASSGLDNFVQQYTSNATGRWASEVIDEFSENGKNTAFVTYASRDGEYSEDNLELINAKNQGGLSYHTPFTMNQILGGNVLEAD